MNEPTTSIIMTSTVFFVTGAALYFVHVSVRYLYCLSKKLECASAASAVCLPFIEIA